MHSLLFIASFVIYCFLCYLLHSQLSIAFAVIRCILCHPLHSLLPAAFSFFFPLPTSFPPRPIPSLNSPSLEYLQSFLRFSIFFRVGSSVTIRFLRFGKHFFAEVSERRHGASKQGRLGPWTLSGWGVWCGWTSCLFFLNVVSRTRFKEGKYGGEI